MRAVPFVCALCALLVLAACAATAEYTIADQLEDFGLGQERSVCIADHMGDNLNGRQLSQFASFLNTVDGGGRPSELIRAAERIADREIGQALVGGAASCALRF